MLRVTEDIIFDLTYKFFRHYRCDPAKDIKSGWHSPFEMKSGICIVCRTEEFRDLIRFLQRVNMEEG